MFTQVMKLSRGWTVYTRHKICIEMELNIHLAFEWHIQALTASFKTQGWPTWKVYSFTPLTLFALLHAQVRRSVMHVVHTLQKWNKGLRSEVNNLLLHIHRLSLICRRVKASSLHLTTRTGNLQSCPPLLPLPFINLARAQESGNEVSITLIYPM